MTGYLLFGLFIIFVIYMARPQREDQVYPASEDVKEEYRKYLEEGSEEDQNKD